MEQKVIHSQIAIAKTVKTNLKNIVAAIGDWPMKLWGEIGRHNLQVAGASVYVYKGCNENPETEFTLQMCIPVVDLSAYKGEFEKVELQEFPCIESLYIGSMPDLGPKGWHPFMNEAISQKAKFTTESREVYIKWVDFQSSENQVLMQMGIQ